MYCTNCGSPIAADASFCSACGTTLGTVRTGDALIGPPEPLFLHISVARLVLLSIASVGLYEAYWIYKNWKNIKDREGLDITPFWRGIFGIFYCHSLLKRIKGDRYASALIEPSFSVQLATGWVLLLILSGVITSVPGPVIVLSHRGCDAVLLVPRPSSELHQLNGEDAVTRC